MKITNEAYPITINNVTHYFTAAQLVLLIQYASKYISRKDWADIANDLRRDGL